MQGNYCHAKWKDHSDLILRPLWEMKGLRKFDVQVCPWDDQELLDQMMIRGEIPEY
jgi:hypothetical protein